MAGPLHGNQETSQGIHVVSKWEYASTGARDAVTYVATDVGGIARVGGAAPYTFYILNDHTGPTWGSVGDMGATVTVTSGEVLFLGDLLAFDSAGEVIRSSSNFAAGKWRLIGISKAAVILGASVDVATSGELILVRFGSAPLASSNGDIVFMSSTVGEATLTPPSSGNVRFVVGVLQGADGITTTPKVLFEPQFIAIIP